MIVCEGAVDCQNRPIKSEYVRTVLEGCGLDARVTQLGHIQRGGAPSAFDRYLATLQGLEAVSAVLDSDASVSPSILIGIKENRIIRLPLMDCVQKSRSQAKLMDELNFHGAFKLRGPDFRASYDIVQSFYSLEEALAKGDRPTSKSLRIALVNCGAPAGGINAANRAVILTCLFKGYQPIGIYNGFSGLIRGDVKEISLADGPFHANRGGSFLGMNRNLPSEDLGLVAYYLQKFAIDGLVIVGGFEAFSSLLVITEARNQYPSFDIPIVVLPATISNNVPGTDFSIGCDTALNIIVRSTDDLKQSASSSRKRVFVVDVQGGYCGYLATMGTLAAGGTCSYIHEEDISLDELAKDTELLRHLFRDDTNQGRIVLRNEFSSEIFSAQQIAKIFEAESGGLFDARWVALGHLQQGGSPSPLDRIRASRLAVLSVSFIESILLGSGGGSLLTSKTEHRKTMDASSAVVIGIRGPSVVFSCCKELLKETEPEYRRPKHQWWMEYRPVIKILSKSPKD